MMLTSKARRFISSAIHGPHLLSKRSLSVITKESQLPPTSTSTIEFYNSAAAADSPQLLTENASLNYKLYYQHGFHSPEEIIEYNAFNDQIWYGREGQETLYKMRNTSEDTKHCDLFMMRDFHNHDIIGCNAIKRLSAPSLATILHGNPDTDTGTDTDTDTDSRGPFHYTLRRNTAIAPALQGQGYGRILREHSRALDDLHVDQFGLSITDVQIKNTASLNLQISSGFEIAAKANVFMYYRGDLDRVDGHSAKKSATANKYELCKITAAEDRPEFDRVCALHSDGFLKKHGIVDLSVHPHGMDPVETVYVLKDKESTDGRVLAAIQAKPWTIQMKPASSVESYAMRLMSRCLRGFVGPATDMHAMFIVGMYFHDLDADADADSKTEINMAQCIESLVTYCLMDNGTHFGVTVIDTRNPFNKFLRAHKTEICGRVGAMMCETDSMNVLMKFQGLTEPEIALLKSNPLQIKLPLPLL